MVANSINQGSQGPVMQQGGYLTLPPGLGQVRSTDVVLVCGFAEKQSCALAAFRADLSCNSSCYYVGVRAAHGRDFICSSFVSPEPSS